MRPVDHPARAVTPRVVGAAHRHDSATRHVNGSASYVDDLREPAGTLHVAVGGAPVARGRITGVDLASVRAAPGVVAVLTAADIPGKNDVSPVKGAISSRREAGEQFTPVAKNALAATDVMVTASGLLRAADLAAFELGMWQGLTGR